MTDKIIDLDKERKQRKPAPGPPPIPDSNFAALAKLQSIAAELHILSEKMRYGKPVSSAKLDKLSRSLNWWTKKLLRNLYGP